MIRPPTLLERHAEVEKKYRAERESKKKREEFEKAKEAARREEEKEGREERRREERRREEGRKRRRKKQRGRKEEEKERREERRREEAAADLPRKNEGKSPSFEKIGKGLEQHLLENSKLRTTEEGQALLKRFLSAISDGTPFQTKPSDVETYGLPNIIMNHRISETFNYAGLARPYGVFKCQ